MVKFTLGSLALVVAHASASASVVAYREIFAHAGTDAPNFSNGQPTNGGLTSTINWNLRGANMVGEATFFASGAPINTVAASAGISTNLGAVNAGPQQGSQTARGFAVIPSSTLAPIANTASYIMYTSEYALGAAGIESVSWYQGNQSTTDVWRLALEVNGSQWIVSDAAFTNAAVTSGAAFATSGEFKSLTFAGAQWRSLAFNGNLAQNSGALTVGALTSGPTGTITRFGLYTDSKNNNMRFDTFQINTVPEPATLVSLVVGGLAVLRRRISSRA